jgi:eukaryotic-like serine/threonine-protein kinase
VTARERGEAAIATPEQALGFVEAHRVHGLFVGMTFGALFLAALVQLMGGDPFAARVHTIALLCSVVVTGAYSILFRNPAHYRPMIAYVILIGSIGVLLTGYYYWGLFSSYIAVVPITIYVAVHAVASLKQAAVGTLTCVVAQTTFGVATVFGWIAPRGLVEPVRGTQTTELIAVAVIQGLTLGAGLLGLDVKRSTRAVIEDHDRAVRKLAQREAQLAEAQAEAVEARKAGGGGPGRFTDHAIGGFKLGDVLGRGAMGEVYAATRLDDGAPCAVKLLAPHLLRDAAAYDRFQREAAILLALESSHVVRVLGVSTSDAQLPYVAMERLVGLDLAELIKGRTLPIGEIVDIVKQVAAGLDAAHRAGVVHRDLKPLNIFAVGDTATRTWKLLDFGIAKWVDSEGSLTRDNVIGTPAYMAPEQAAGAKVDFRSDIYALGVIAYRMVTGAPAVVPRDVHAMLHEVVFKMPVQPRELADVSPQIEAVLAIALAKDPNQRFASAGELAQALGDAAAGQLSRALVDRAERILALTPWGRWSERPTP